MRSRMKSTLSQRPNRLLPEILVTGCIIIFVATLVTRTYTGSMTQANRIACINNVSQLGRAMLTYCCDYDQKFPLGPSWQDAVMVYVSDIPDWNIYYCPARGEERGYSYGLNRHLGGATDFSFQYPTEAVMLVDVRGSTRDIWWSNDIRFENIRHNRCPLPCHAMRSNFVFCDGHASTIDPFILTTESWTVTEDDRIEEGQPFRSEDATE